MWGGSFGSSRNSGAGAPGRKIPATIFRLLSSSATYVVPFSMTGLLSPVALFRAGTIHDHAIGQAGPSILSRSPGARPLAVCCYHRGGMVVLGISETHCATAAVLRDGAIVCCASEERFSRLKKDAAYPRLATDALLRDLALSPSAIDRVVLAGTRI